MKHLVTAAALAFALTGVAQAADLKIGVIDLQHIVQQSPQTKKIASKLKSKFGSREARIVKAQKSLQKQMAKFDRDSSVMSASARTKAQDKIYAAKRDLQRRQEDFQREVTIAQNKAMQGFLNRVKTAVNNVAEDGHYDIILQKNSVPYASHNVDVTGKVLKKLG